MAEQVMGAIPNIRKKKLFGLGDTYTLVVTDQQLVFAQLTSALMKKTVAEAQQKAKAEGKGFFARMGAQMSAHANLHARYVTMPVEAILAETAGNFAVPHASITGVSLVKRPYDEDRDTKILSDLRIESAGGAHEFVVEGIEHEWLELLTTALPGKGRSALFSVLQPAETVFS